MIIATAKIVVTDRPFPETMRECSHDACVVMLGFGVVEGADFILFHDRMEKLLEGLPTTLLVSSTGDADLFA